jgi:hypothetical protein
VVLGWVVNLTVGSCLTDALPPLSKNMATWTSETSVEMMHLLEGEEESLMSQTFLWLWKRRTHLKKRAITNDLYFTDTFFHVN